MEKFLPMSSKQIKFLCVEHEEKFHEYKKAINGYL